MLLWVSLMAPAASVWQQRRGRVLSGGVGAVLAVAGAAYGVLIIIGRGIGAALLAAAVAMVVVLVARLLTRERLRHDLQALLISLLLVFSGAGLHTQFTYGIIFVAYAVAAVWALISRELVAGAEREAQRAGGATVSVTLARRDVVTPRFFAVTGGVALAILVCTSFVFVFFPRVGFGTLGFLAQRQSALPDEVSLKDAPRAGAGSRVLARVRGLPFARFAQGLYLRAGAYERLTGDGFARASGERLSATQRLPLAAPEQAYSYDVYMQPLGQRQMLTLGPLDEATVVAGGFGNPNLRAQIFWFGRGGLLRTPVPLAGPIRYEVTGRIAGPAGAELASSARHTAPRLSGQHRRRLLRVPVALAEPLKPLARDIVRGATAPAAKAARIRRYLRRNYSYRLAQPAQTGVAPLNAFLFEHRQGHCEYFATAFAAMLRVVGIPARVVGGFFGGRWDTQGGVAVFTAADAHAWIEWYAPGVGWVLDDATPAARGERRRLAGWAAFVERMRRAWDDYVLEYGIAEQMRVVRALAGRFEDFDVPTAALPSRLLAGVALAGGLVAGGALLLWRRRSRHQNRGHPLANAIGESLAALLGRPLARHETYRRALAEAQAAYATEQSAAARLQVLNEAVLLYERERFGARPAAKERRKRLLQQMRTWRRR